VVGSSELSNETLGSMQRADFLTEKVLASQRFWPMELIDINQARNENRRRKCRLQ
jgi:hypothetical protein